MHQGQHRLAVDFSVAALDASHHVAFGEGMGEEVEVVEEEQAAVAAAVDVGVFPVLLGYHHVIVVQDGDELLVSVGFEVGHAGVFRGEGIHLGVGAAGGVATLEGFGFDGGVLADRQGFPGEVLIADFGRLTAIEGVADGGVGGDGAHGH